MKNDVIEEITIGKNIERIQDDSFYDCNKLRIVKFNEDSQCTNIGEDAFYNCNSLVSVDLGNNSACTIIKDRAFINCSSLETFNFGENSKLEIIGASAFENCETLPEISIPDTVQTIAENAFKNCALLEKVSFNDEDEKGKTGNSALATIGDSAFEECKALIEIIIPASTITIGDRAFYNNESLETLEFTPAEEGQTSLDTIGKSAFENCIVLKAVDIPANTKSIGDAAFKGDTSIETLTFAKLVDPIEPEPENPDYTTYLQSIGDEAFMGCESFETLVLPEGLQTVGESTFQDCAKLKVLEICGSIDEFGASAFAGCEDLISINILPRDKDEDGKDLDPTTLGEDVWPFDIYNFDLATNAYKVVNASGDVIDTFGKFMVRQRNVGGKNVNVFDQVFDLKGMVYLDGNPAGNFKVTIDDGRYAEGALQIGQIELPEIAISPTDEPKENENSAVKLIRPNFVISEVDGSFEFCDEFCGLASNTIALELNGIRQINDGAFGPIVGDTNAEIQLETIPIPFGNRGIQEFNVGDFPAPWPYLLDFIHEIPWWL